MRFTVRSLAVVAVLCLACSPNSPPTSSDTGTPSPGRTAQAASRLSRLDGRAMRVRMTYKPKGSTSLLVSSTPLKFRYSADTRTVKLIRSSQDDAACASKSLGKSLERVGDCAYGNAMWDPNADTSFVESTSAIFSSAGSASTVIQTHPELGGDNESGVIALNTSDSIPESQFSAGVSVRGDGTFDGVALVGEDVTFAAAFAYDTYGAVETVLYTLANTYGDTVFVTVAPDDCQATSSCLRESEAGREMAAMESDCLGKFFAVLGRGVIAAGAVTATVGMLTPPGPIARAAVTIVTTAPKLTKAWTAVWEGAHVLRAMTGGSSLVKWTLAATGIGGIVESGKSFAQAVNTFSHDCPFGGHT